VPSGRTVYSVKGPTHVVKRVVGIELFIGLRKACENPLQVGNSYLKGRWPKKCPTKAKGPFGYPRDLGKKIRPKSVRGPTKRKKVKGQARSTSGQWKRESGPQAQALGTANLRRVTPWERPTKPKTGVPTQGNNPGKAQIRNKRWFQTWPKRLKRNRVQVDRSPRSNGSFLVPVPNSEWMVQGKPIPKFLRIRRKEPRSNRGS